ncbi:hypothetical protein JCM3765_005216 [Sporobolomyces pararoseus]
MSSTTTTPQPSSAKAQPSAATEGECVVCGKLRQLDLRAQIARDPYGYLASYLDFAWPTLCMFEDQHYGWYSDLHHRFSILFALICRNYQTPARYLDYTSLVKYALDRILELLQDRVSQDRPEEARKMVAVVKLTSVKSFEHPQTGETVGLIVLGECGRST